MANVEAYAKFIKRPKRTFESVKKGRKPRILRCYAGDQFSICFDAENVYGTGLNDYGQLGEQTVVKGVYDTSGELVKRMNQFGRVLEEQETGEPEREYVVPAWKRLDLPLSQTHTPIDAGCGGAHCAIVFSSKQVKRDAKFKFCILCIS